MMITETKSTLAACLTCGHQLDTVAGEGSPTPGCIILCAYCGQIYLIEDDLQARMVCGAERDVMISALPDLRRALAVRAVTMGNLSTEEIEALEHRTPTDVAAIDPAELVALAEPIRDELVQARLEVRRLIIAANDLDSTPEARAAAREGLRSARMHRDVLRRLLFAVQTYLDAEGGV